MMRKPRKLPTTYFVVHGGRSEPLGLEQAWPTWEQAYDEALDQALRGDTSYVAEVQVVSRTRFPARPQR